MRGRGALVGVLLALFVAAPAWGSADEPDMTTFAPLRWAPWKAEQRDERPMSAAVAARVGKGPDGGPGVAHHAGARPVDNPPDPIPSGVQHSTGRPTVEQLVGGPRLR